MAHIPGGGVPLTKVEQYKWTLVDKPGEFAFLPKGEINVDHGYQRERVSLRKVAMFAQAWSWAACGVLSVAMRPDGSFWVFDGQHRKLAADKRADIDLLPCMVFESTGVKDEASAFLTANTTRTSMMTPDKFSALIIAEDPVALGILEMVRQHGYAIQSSGAASGTVGCIAEIMLAFRADKDACKKAFAACVEIAAGRRFPNKMFAAAFYLERFLASAKQGSILDPLNKRKLINTGIEGCVREIAKVQGALGKTGPKIFAAALVQILNKGRSEANRINFSL